MKQQLIIISILCFGFLTANSQRMDDSLQYKFYVNEQFQSGVVTFKAMPQTTALLNYSSFDQSIVFKKDGQVLSLTNFDDIDTVYIHSKKYVPLKKVIYEVIDNKNKDVLLATYSYKMNFTPATTDHNGSHTVDNAMVSNTVTSSYVNRPYKADYNLSVEKNYFIRVYNKNYRIKSISDWLKIFPESKSEQIKAYVQSNHINFTFEDDLIVLLDYSSSI